MKLLHAHQVPSYTQIAAAGIAVGFSAAVTVSVIVRWPGADKIAFFAWGTTAGLILIGYLYRALWLRRSGRARPHLSTIGLREGADLLLQVGEEAARSAYRVNLATEFHRLAGEPLDRLPLRLHPAALGLLVCQVDFMEHHPEWRAAGMAGLRGGILGLVAAGQIYELERPRSREPVPS